MPLGARPCRELEVHEPSPQSIAWPAQAQGNRRQNDFIDLKGLWMIE
jgi:hypothetical protein